LPISSKHRDAILARVASIRTVAAQLSRLLAEELLQDEELDRAVSILASCRAERKKLNDQLLGTEDVE
jgi:uncharacterized protein YqgQ